MTEPPLAVQYRPKKPLPLAAATPVVPSAYVQLENFLPESENWALLDYVLQREAKFVSSTTSTGERDYRYSSVLYSFPEVAEQFSQRLQAAFPEVLSKLNLPLFSVRHIEMQLTAHNDSHYFKIHNDNGSTETASRELTYVYYFHREPKPFSGGELRIYDSKVENNFYVKAESFRVVQPRNNSIVFFLSRYLHEVLPVSCPSQRFADSRFTINGWIHR